MACEIGSMGQLHNCDIHYYKRCELSVSRILKQANSQDQIFKNTLYILSIGVDCELYDVPDIIVKNLGYIQIYNTLII